MGRTLIEHAPDMRGERNIVEELPGEDLLAFIKSSIREREADVGELDIAAREERNYSTTNTYVDVPASLRYAGAAFPIVIGDGYYNVNVAVTAAAPGVPNLRWIRTAPMPRQTAGAE